jgi:hypothetical protein
MSDRSETIGLQNDISGIVKSQLNQKLDRLFGRITNDSEVLKIENLEVDLGTIRTGSLAEDFVNKAVNQIEEQLIKIIRQPSVNQNVQDRTGQGTSGKNTTVLISKHQENLNAVIHFLKYGSLPWWGSVSTKKGFEEQFKKLVMNNLNATRMQLLPLFDDATVRQRFIYQSTQTLRKHLLTLTNVRRPETILIFVETVETVLFHYIKHQPDYLKTGKLKKKRITQKDKTVKIGLDSVVENKSIIHRSPQWIDHVIWDHTISILLDNVGENFTQYSSKIVGLVINDFLTGRTMDQRAEILHKLLICVRQLKHKIATSDFKLIEQVIVNQTKVSNTNLKSIPVGQLDQDDTDHSDVPDSTKSTSTDSVERENQAFLNEKISDSEAHLKDLTEQSDLKDIANEESFINKETYYPAKNESRSGDHIKAENANIIRDVDAKDEEEEYTNFRIERVQPKGENPKNSGHIEEKDAYKSKNSQKSVIKDEGAFETKLKNNNPSGDPSEGKSPDLRQGVADDNSKEERSEKSKHPETNEPEHQDITSDKSGIELSHLVNIEKTDNSFDLPADLKTDQIRRNNDIPEGMIDRQSKLPKSLFPNRKFELPDGEDVMIYNAGLVILHPFLKFFFEGLELMKNNQFVDQESRHKAVHLLQYMVTQEKQTTEDQLILNKLLCGIHPTEPVPLSVNLTDDDLDECDNLLKAVLKQWTALRSDLPEAIRSTFLNREGILIRNSGWTLKVKRNTLDILLDRLPWGISLIKLPWNPEIIYVEW